MEQKYLPSPRAAVTDGGPSFPLDGFALDETGTAGPDHGADPHARANGWSGARQRRFCEYLAESGNVSEAAHAVGMSREGAYRFRRRAAGRAFGVAWEAALRLARKRLVDDVFELARTGIHETVYKDGEIVAERRRRDPRVLLTTIERLAKLEAREDHVTKCVAEEFDGFLDCLSPEDGEAAQGPRDGAPHNIDPSDADLCDADPCDGDPCAPAHVPEAASEEDRTVARAAARFFEAHMPCKGTDYYAAQAFETLVIALESYGGDKAAAARVRQRYPDFNSMGAGMDMSMMPDWLAADAGEEE